MKFHPTTSFGSAVCRHFKLPPGQVLQLVKVNTAPDEIFSVSVTIALSPEDLRAIADQMERSATDGQAKDA